MKQNVIIIDEPPLINWFDVIWFSRHFHYFKSWPTEGIHLICPIQKYKIRQLFLTCYVVGCWCLFIFFFFFFIILLLVCRKWMFTPQRITWNFPIHLTLMDSIMEKVLWKLFVYLTIQNQYIVWCNWHKCIKYKTIDCLKFLKWFLNTLQLRIPLNIHKCYGVLWYPIQLEYHSIRSSGRCFVLLFFFFLFLAMFENHFIHHRSLLSNFNNDVNLLDSLDYISIEPSITFFYIYAGKSALE